MNELSANGVISILTNSSLYNKTYYNVNELLTPNHNKLVSIIEAQDMIYGDYYSASIINYFRMQAVKQEKIIKLSIKELSDKLQFNASIPTISKRIKELERNNILKSTLNGRVYEYEINTELILKTLTPEVVDSLSSVLSNILKHYLKRIGKQETNGNKEVFSRMLLSGYDFSTIKQIIASLALTKTRFNEIIYNATHIKTHYAELAQLSRHLSKRKANRFIYQLLNYVARPKKKSVAVEAKSKGVSEYQLWFDIDAYVKANLKAIRYLYNQFKYATYVDFEDIVQQCKLIFYEKKRKKGMAFNEVDLYSEIRTYMGYKRDAKKIDADFDENQSIEFDDKEDIAEFYSKLDKISDGNIATYLSEQFRHIPIKAMSLILEKLGLYGVTYTYGELAAKYNLNKGTLNVYLKPYLDEILEITGIQLKGAGNYASKSTRKQNAV